MVSKGLVTLINDIRLIDIPFPWTVGREVQTGANIKNPGTRTIYCENLTRTLFLQRDALEEKSRQLAEAHVMIDSLRDGSRTHLANIHREKADVLFKIVERDSQLQAAHAHIVALKARVAEVEALRRAATAKHGH